MSNKEEILAEFDKRVNELHTTQDFTNNNDGKVCEFGYKTLREDEIFTVVDMGNIKNFISKALAAQEEKLSKEMADAIEMSKIGWVDEGRIEVKKEIKEMVEKILKGKDVVGNQYVFPYKFNDEMSNLLAKLKKD